MKIVFATYNVDKTGKKNCNFTAYKKFSYFGGFHEFGKFWFHKTDGWLCSMDVRADDDKQKVKKFEDEIYKFYGAKVIWMNSDLFAYKMKDGKIVIK